MAETQVKAANVKQLTIRKPDGRPEIALLEVQTQAGQTYYALSRTQLLQAAELMRRYAETMPAEAGTPASAT